MCTTELSKNKKVRMWEEDITIPTYEVGTPEKNPLFLEKRVYQGSTGKVYPLPVIDKIYDEKVDKTYKAVFLENEYLHIMILPELGGRIQRALDKTNNYDFVYYNHVIKPALVGLLGPWISGGIEFNWPQHHRPSTFMPTDYSLEEFADGSKTLWVSEVDRMYGTKGMAGFTLYPDKAYIEIKGQLYNRTDIPQTFLWWANPALPVNDYTQSIFPTDVHAVMDHGKRAVASFPIATGEYYKYDYAPGTDISRYKNIKVPTSYMAYESDYNFVGGYDHSIEAGLLHVANHHISPGKKQWVWGNGDFGQAWDRHLTDVNGPYVELMTGVFTDNQPDFTWLNPYEEKTFKQYFFPYKKVGEVKNSSIDAAVNLEVDNGKARVVVYATGEFENATIILEGKAKRYLNETVNLSPTSTFEIEVPVNEGATHLGLFVLDQAGKELISYVPQTGAEKPIPDPATAILAPEKLETTEDLYLAALHLEQYRHATYNPESYYLEGLKRDKTDIRLNNGYGLFLYRRGLFAESEKYFREAIAKQTWKNPNPYDGEPYFNLGLCLLKQGKIEEAYGAFYKSTWNEATQASAFYQIACIDSRKGDFQLALEHVDRALVKNYHNIKARGLKVVILRKLGRLKEATVLITENLKLDKFDYVSQFEHYLISGDAVDLEFLQAMIKQGVNQYLELALDYMQGGFYETAVQTLEMCKLESPLIYYYKGYANVLVGKLEEAKANFETAETINPACCFPNKLDEILILEKAIELNKAGSYAHYYLGNLWYDKRQYEVAIANWEQSVALNTMLPTVHRNLALAYYNKKSDEQKALQSLEKAFELDRADARIFLELDQLYKKMNFPLETRLAKMQDYYDLIEKRDDLMVEYITILNSLGQYTKAYELTVEHKFHPWEGGEGKISSQYIYALTELAKIDIASKKYEEALTKLTDALSYPPNLGEGKLPNTQDNIIHYYIGCVYEGLENTELAQEYFTKASVGLQEPTDMMFYNDQPADTIFYQGKAFEKLGMTELAKARYTTLLDYAKEHMEDLIEIDYFAVSLPDTLIFEEDLQKKNKVHCLYLAGLGELGLGQVEKAKQHLQASGTMNVSHQGILRHLGLLSYKL